MAMKKEDMYQHPLRLNLNNPYHLRIHQQLLNVNKSIYKSKNEFIVQKLYDGIFGDEMEITKDALKEMEERITLRVTQNILTSILGMQGMNMDAKKIVADTKETTDGSIETVSENVLDAALGYFDD